MVKMNKKGMGLEKYAIGIILFVMVVYSFYVVPNLPEGFYSSYGYNLTDSTLSSFDQTENVTDFGSQLACDTTRIGSENSNCNSGERSIIDVANFVQNMVGNAYNGVVTIYNTFGMSKILLSSLVEMFHVPPVIATMILTLMLVSLCIALILLIFNRSDSG